MIKETSHMMKNRDVTFQFPVHLSTIQQWISLHCYIKPEIKQFNSVFFSFISLNLLHAQ